MKLDDKTIRRILIGAVVIIVLLFVVVKVYQKTYYKYPNPVETAILSISAISFTSPTVTVTTTASHGYEVGELVVIYGTGLTFTGTKGLSTLATSLYGTLPTGSIVVPVASGSGSTFTFTAATMSGTFTSGTARVESPAKGIKTTLDLAMVQCQNKYALDIVSGVAQATRDATRQTCIVAAVAPYLSNHCKYLTPTTIPAATDDPVAFDAYTEYRSAIQTIANAYAFAVARADSGTFSGVPTVATAQSLVNKARQADITGATRRYIAKACPQFYHVSADATLYKGWVTAPGGSAKPGSGYGFWSVTPAQSGTTTTGGISDNDILVWSDYAGTTTLTAGVLTRTGSSGIAGRTDKSTAGPVGSENFRKASENGPGTYGGPAFA